MKNQLGPFLIIILLGCIWGSSFILIKRGLESFSAIQVAGWRQFLAGVFLLPWAIKYTLIKPFGILSYGKEGEKLLDATENIPIERIVKKEDYWNLFLSGLIGNGIPAFLFSFAGTRIPGALSGILNALTPMFTLLIGVWFYNTKTTKNGVWGLIFGIVGAVIILGPQFFIHNASIDIDLLGASMALCATIMYGYNINLIKTKLSHLPPMVKTAYPFVFVGFIYFFILLFTQVFDAWNQNSILAWKSLGYLAILGFVGSALSMVIFNILIKRTTALVASTNTFIIPIVAVLWGIADHETITWTMVLGLVCIFVAVYLIVFKNSDK